MEWLETEHDNLLSALHWAEENPRLRLDADFIESLTYYWFTRGNLSEGRVVLSGILKYPLVLGDPSFHARLLNQVGFLARYQGDFAAAYGLISESLAICRQLENKQLTADVMANLGYVVLYQGDHSQATTIYTEALVLYREVKNLQGMADTLSNMAQIPFYEHDYETAKRYVEEALLYWREEGDQLGIGWALYQLGSVAFYQGDRATARDLFRESLNLGKKVGTNWGLANALEGFASLAAAEGKDERAFQLAGAASALRQAHGASLSAAAQAVFDSTLAPARQGLDEHVIYQAWVKGQSMQLEEIVTFAFEDL
jgi:non-specific serine/threonine protein kinase